MTPVPLVGVSSKAVSLDTHTRTSTQLRNLLCVSVCVFELAAAARDGSQTGARDKERESSTLEMRRLQNSSESNAPSLSLLRGGSLPPSQCVIARSSGGGGGSSGGAVVVVGVI